MIQIFGINIHKINEEYENSLQKKIVQISNYNSNYFEKRILAIKLDKSTMILNANKNPVFISLLDETIQNLINSTSLNNAFALSFSNSLQNYSSIEDSTFQETKSLIKEQDYYPALENLPIVNKFNSLRSNFYIKYKLYDITLYDSFNNFNNPPKYIINDELFAFLYPNEIKTFPIKISGFLGSNQIKIEPEIEEIKDSRFNKQFGLFFCGGIIEIENETKKCTPNIFMCKTCMDMNKKLYNIKSNHLINIAGRVSKINTGSYHCFGHFLNGNMIEDCIAKFTCKACQLLNFYSKYFS